MKGPHGSPPDVISFLRGVPLFVGLDGGMLQALARAGQLCRMPKGRLLFSQSDSSEAFYVVRSGCIVILLDSPAEQYPQVLFETRRPQSTASNP